MYEGGLSTTTPLGLDLLEGRRQAGRVTREGHSRLVRPGIAIGSTAVPVRA